MKLGRLCGVGVSLGMLLLAGSWSREDAGATEVLLDPGFDDWSGATLSQWAVPDGPIAQEDVRALSGSAVRTVDGHTIISQSVAVTPGATYAVSAWFATDSTATATVQVRFLDDGFSHIQADSASDTLGESFGEVGIAALAPASPVPAAFATVTIEVVGAGPTYIDAASLDETLPPPTATPTEIPSPTPTETDVPATTGASTATTTSSAASATPTADTTATATPTRTSTATRTPIGTGSPTATRTPTRTATPPRAATPTRSPTLASPPQVASEHLLNGDFEAGELADQSKPKHWAKFGGNVRRDSASYHGQHAARLDSTTSSTKWITQLVEVKPGQWYSARAYGRVAAGGGEVFLRLSWYSLKNGDGSAIGTDDSPVSSSSDWTLLDTGAVQAPTDAYSVRVRLMVRPEGPMTALFDDASFTATTEPASTPTPTATSTTGAAPSSTAKSTATPRPTSTPRTGGERTSGRPPATPIVSTVVNLTGPHTLRISEVLSDPAESGRDGPFEWVELVNVGTEPVSTAGWRLGDGAEVDALPELIVPSGGYLVVAGSQAAIPPDVAVVHVEDGEIGNALNNTGDVIRLIAPDGTEVDLLSYGDNTDIFDPAPPAAAAGETLGVRTAGADPDASNWSITLRPTPGEPNLFPAPPAEETAVAGERPQSPVEDDEQRGLFEPRDDGGGASPLPWIMLGVAASAGAYAAYGQRGRALEYWKKVRRDR